MNEQKSKEGKENKRKMRRRFPQGREGSEIAGAKTLHLADELYIINEILRFISIMGEKRKSYGL